MTSTVFRVLTYNIFCPLPEPLRLCGQTERARRVADVIQNIEAQHDSIDAVVFQEVMAPNVQTLILDAMPRIGFPYHTTRLSQPLTVVTGGALIFSKHPITFEDQTTFGDRCVGSDCFAAKGVVLARICREGQYFNVAGTHLQAWQNLEAQAAREQQWKQISDFLQSLRIPAHEPLLLCGDINIDMYLQSDHLRHLTFTMGMKVPPLSEHSQRLTVDPTLNPLVGADDIDTYRNATYPQGCKAEYLKQLRCPCCPAEWVDYTLYSTRHLQPRSARMTSMLATVPPFTITFGATQTIEIDQVSDHFPVLGEFEFPLNASTSSTTSPARLQRHTRVDEQGVVNLTLAIFVLLLVIATVSIALYWVGRRVWRSAKKDASLASQK